MTGQPDRFSAHAEPEEEASPHTFCNTTTDGQTSPPVIGSKATLPTGLYVVATPIGNLGDISARALQALEQADLIACEDSRVTAKLLRYFGLRRPLLSYHEHNAAQAGEKILHALRQGQRVVQVSDAGCPVICDPGERLVRQARAENLPVTVIPGPSAVMTALQLSGLPSAPFLFLGFLAAKTTARRQDLRRFATLEATLVAFEAPHRLVDSLADCAAVLGDRPAAVVREMTKLFEEVRNGSLPDLAAHYAEQGPPKGEIVLVIGPPQAEGATASESDLEALLHDELNKGTSVKDAASLIAALTGHPRRTVYALALSLHRGDRA